MDIVASRKHFDVTNKDLVMFNGACYQLTTKRYLKYDDANHLFSRYRTPIIPNSRAEKWIKQGVLVLEKVTGNAENRNEIKYYRFNISESEGA